MKIVYDARHIENPYSGLGRYTSSLLDGLIKCGQLFTELIIILNKNTSYYNNPHFELINYLKKDKRCSVLYVDAPLFGLKHHFNISRIVNTIKPDLYFYPHFDVPIFINMPTKFVVHDLLPLIVINYIIKFKYIKKIYFHTLILFSLHRRTNRCIAVSETTKKDIIKFFGIKYSDKIQVVFEAPFETFWENKSSNEITKPFLFYVGDRRPHKNLKKMIDVFLILKSKYHYIGEFIIAGNKKNFGLNIDNYTKDVADIRFLGSIDDEELNRYYQTMDSLFLFESLRNPVIRVLIIAYVENIFHSAGRLIRASRQ